MTIHPRALRRIAAGCAALVVLTAGAAWWATDNQPTPAATSSTCETP